jgi:RNA polymerase sigma factor (TIGR02999 family)
LLIAVGYLKKIAKIFRVSINTQCPKGKITMPEMELGKEPGDDYVRQLLLAWSQGDQQAFDELARLVEAELRRLARHYLSNERRGHTMQTTDLINEAWLRLIGQTKDIHWQSRAHFVAIAATLMRRVLVDHARKRRSDKRGGEFEKVTFEKALQVSYEPEFDMLALDEFLTELAELDKRAADVVELRFFGGLTTKETAGALGISPDTVERDWKFAKAWLLNKLKG